jgi:hypothetical protein
MTRRPTEGTTERPRSPDFKLQQFPKERRLFQRKLGKLFPMVKLALSNLTTKAIPALENRQN